MKSLASASLVVVCGVAAVPEIVACGGCYNEFMVADLRTEPATACLMLGASEVDQCTADYDVIVQNGCVEDLTIGSQTIGAGASGRIRGADVPTDAAGRHSVEGMVGAAPVTISWVLVDTSDD
jgi:hypothetical protein